MPVTTIARAGTTWPPTEVNGDATNQHQVLNSDARTIIVVRNSGVVDRTVTFRIPKTVDGQAVAPVVRTLAASAVKAFGTFSADDYGSTLLIDVEHSDLKLYAFRAV